MDMLLVNACVCVLSSLFVKEICSSGHFENVALNKACNMSSQYHWLIATHPPGAAANGNTDGVYGKKNNCIHTAVNDTAPWWQVDLGRLYSVHRIVVWARTAEIHRMKGCIIYVDGKECYQFGYTEPSGKTNVTCVTGVINGRTVRLAKNTTGFTGDNITINMCELQVLSCSDNYWGSGCDRRCGNCSNAEVCDKVTGHCSSCPPGLQPPLCDTGCKDGTFGLNCTHNCGEGCEDVCNKVSGHCSCKSGWEEPSCTECDNGIFGNNCIQNCSESCDTVCNKVSGHCKCKPGWMGLACDAEERTEGEPITTGMLVGAVVGSLCAVAVLFVVVFVAVRWLRSRSRRSNGNSTRDAASYGAGIDSAQILPSTNRRNPVTLSSSQSDDVYEPVDGEVNHVYVNSQKAMPATTKNPAERFPAASEVGVVEGKSSIEPPRESSAPSTDQPYEVMDRDNENTYEKTQMYVNTGDHHVYSDLKT